MTRSPSPKLAYSRNLSLLCLAILGATPACSEGTAEPDEVTTGGAFSTGGVTSGGSPSSGGALSTGGVGTGGIATGGASGGSGSGGSGATGSGGSSTGGALGTGGDGAGGQGAGGAAAGGSEGTGGDPGSGGMDGGGDFMPCPADGACKILPLGDSITFGIGYEGAWRVELFRLAHSEGHDITFTGTQQPNGPSMVDGVPFPRNHAGISGQTIDQIAGRIPNPDYQDPAHIILVHAGTNDMVGNSASTAHERLGNMMDKLITEAPDALLVFSTIIPLSFGGGDLDAFNSHVQDMVDERAAMGAHILFVDQFEGFPTSELGDGVHPNQAGYNRMGAKFYDAIKSYLP